MNEIDNHADTICAGPNWTLLELSGEYCNVSPFSTDYQPKTDVPIARCATTYTCPTSGDSVVLVADQVLWFGDELHCSLINPHQIRYHGYGVCDDPWDPHRSLGIDLDSIFIPLKTSGPTQVFPLLGNWKIYRSSRLLRRPGIPRTYKCLHRSRIRIVLSTVYRPLAGIYGPNRQHLCRRSPLPLIHDVSSPCM